MHTEGILVIDPDVFQDEFNSKEAASTLWLNGKSKHFLFLLLSILIAFSYFLIGPLLTLKYKFLYFSNVQLAFNTILLAAAASLIMLYLGYIKRRSYLIFLLFIGVAVFDYSQSRWFLKSGQWDTFYFIFLQMLAGYLALKYSNEKNKYLAISFYLIVSILSLFLVYFLTKTYGWYYFHQPILFMAFVTGFILESVKLDDEQRRTIIFNPSHLFLSVNYPIDEYLQNKELNYKNTWCSGLLDLSKAILALLFTLLLDYLIATDDTNLPLMTIKDYILYLLVVITIGNTVTGLSKLYLINVPRCSNFAFLSKSPLDFMKRENAHAYIFSFRFIYFNLLKYNKKPYFNILVYFLIFPFYRNFLIFFTKPMAFSWHEFIIFILGGYIFWSMLLFAIVFFPTKLLSKYQSSPWIQILSTHAAMITVFFVFKLVSSTFLTI